MGERRGSTCMKDPWTRTMGWGKRLNVREAAWAGQGRVMEAKRG